MNIPAKNLLLVFLCFNHLLFFGQEVKEIHYGGKGNRFNGTLNVEYFIESGNRRYLIDSLTKEIDLNKYKEEVRFSIQVSNLRLGLNNALTKVRNSSHPKVYYLEVSRVNIPIEGVTSIEKDTVKISSKTGHYGDDVAAIKYSIDRIQTKKRVVFQSKTKIIDGVFGRQWNTIILSKSIIILPRIDKAIPDTLIEKNTNTASVRNKTNYRYRNRVSKEKKDPKIDSLVTQEKTIEDRLWAKIEKDLISNRKDKVLEQCKVYLKNCELQIFDKCKHQEKALFYIANYIEEDKKEDVVKNYKERYPLGMYLDQLEKLIHKPEIPVIPIEPDIAKLDFDNKALLINRIKGGIRPYYVGFFDDTKNKDYAVKRIRFNKMDMYIDLETLEIPEGFYKVKVMDAKGKLFVEKQNIYISEIFSLPKSIKLSILIVVLGFVSFLYKKYIHF